MLEAQMHFVKVEKWFLMLLEVEYFHYNQLKVLVFLVYQIPKIMSLTVQISKY